MTTDNPIQAVSPLMLPMQYNGQTYYTSHFFHRHYQANQPDGGKYARHGDFMRLIRGIEAYPLYIERGDIVEIGSKSDVDAGGETQNLRLAYKSNNYAPIMLINATAQVALTHHLDDEISKQVSVAVNQSVVKQAQRHPNLPEFDVAVRGMSFIYDYLNMSESAKITGMLHVCRQFGMDTMALPGYAVDAPKSVELAGSSKPTQSATALLKVFGSRIKAAEFNQLCESAGVLVQRTRKSNKRDANGLPVDKKFWAVTDTGTKYGKNLTSDKNPRETQPHWYDHTFQSLLDLIGA